MSTNTDDPLLTPADAAALLNIQVRTLREWRAKKTGPPAIKLGYRTVRYRKSAVQEYATSREQRAEEPK